MRKKTTKIPCEYTSYTLIAKDSITIQVFNNGIYDKKAATQMLLPFHMYRSSTISMYYHRERVVLACASGCAEDVNFDLCQSN